MAYIMVLNDLMAQCNNYSHLFFLLIHTLGILNSIKRLVTVIFRVGDTLNAYVFVLMHSGCPGWSVYSLAFVVVFFYPLSFCSPSINLRRCW